MVNNDPNQTFVNFGELAQAREAFSLKYNQIEGALNDLEGNLDKLLGTWEGDARTAYWEARKEWEAASARMSNLVNQLGGVIEQASENFTTAEKTNVSMFSGTGGR